jgi:hypothetical protein
MRKRCWLTQQNPKEVKKKHKHQKRETKGTVTCGRLVIFDNLVHCECPQKDDMPSSYATSTNSLWICLKHQTKPNLSKALLGFPDKAVWQHPATASIEQAILIGNIFDPPLLPYSSLK